jgi:hypothetical protein
MLPYSKYRLCIGAFRAVAGSPLHDWRHRHAWVEARRQALCATDRFYRALAWMIADLEACHHAQATGEMVALAAIGAVFKRKAV